MIARFYDFTILRFYDFTILPSFGQVKKSDVLEHIACRSVCRPPILNKFAGNWRTTWSSTCFKTSNANESLCSIILLVEASFHFLVLMNINVLMKILLECFSLKCVMTTKNES